MGKCDQDNTCFSILKTLFSRVFFLIHIFLSVWRVATVYGQVYWCLMLLVILLLSDTVYTIVKRKGHEFKWASTSFLAFLIAAVPPIWLLELHRFDRYHQLKNQTDHVSKEEGLSNLAGFSIPLYLESDMWVKILQQTFILLLIPVRWILPRGQITRDRLSQILLVYIALGADIIELLDVYDIPAVMEDGTVFIVVLAVWTISLIQFIFLLASSAGRRSRMAFITPQTEHRSSHVDLHDRKESIITIPEEDEGRKCKKVEVSALVMTLFLQDIPFLILRLYIMIRFKEFSNTLLFFVSKNIFVILLQFYRMCIVGCCEEEVDEDNDGIADERQDQNPGDNPKVIQVQEAGHTTGQIPEPTKPPDATVIVVTDVPTNPTDATVTETDVPTNPTDATVTETDVPTNPTNATVNVADVPKSPTVITVAEVGDSAV